MLFLASNLLFFSIAFPIMQGSSYQSLLNEKQSNSEKIVAILEESKLAKYDKKRKALSNAEGIYHVSVYQSIKYCYEAYPEIYRNDLESVGYLEYKDFFKNVEIDSYESNRLAYFYTSYIIDKKDSKDEKIVSYSKEESYAYYVKEVLDVANDGQRFFDYDESDYSKLPRLKKDVCRYLFEYHVKKIRYSTLTEVGEKYKKYYIDRYAEAGNLLLKYKEYERSFTAYSSLYAKIEQIGVGALLSSFLFSFLAIFVLVPALDRKARNPSEMLFRSVKLDEGRMVNKKRVLLSSFLYFLRYLFLIVPLAMIQGGINLLNFPFLSLGLFNFNLLHFGLLSFILGIISLFFMTFSKSKKSLASRLSRLKLYDIYESKNSLNPDKASDNA